MMSEVVLTQAQIKELRGYINRKDTYGGWRYLANSGDRYADNAAGIVGKANLDGFDLWVKKAVENLWDDTVGQEVRLEKFDDVALQHFKQYVDLIDDKNGRLPNTSEIEKSYYKAVTINGVSSSAAIDLVINRVAPEGYWATGLGLEFGRIDGTHAVSNPNGSTLDNAGLLGSALVKGLGDAFIENPLTFKRDVENDLTRLALDYRKDALKGINEFSKDLFNAVKDGMEQAIDDAANKYNQAKSDFQQGLNSFQKAMNELGNDLSEKRNDFTQAAEEIYNDITDNVSQGIEQGIEAAKQLAEGIKNAASELADDLAQKVTQAAEDLAKAAKEAYERVKSAAEQAAEAARDFFDNLPDINDLFDKFKDLLPNQEDWIDNLPKWAKEWLGLNAKRSGKAHGYDPLILDLGGNGIETISVAAFSGSLFDHNNDGIRTATGWISADDGLLVRDLNGNGLIDNGSELFGNNTRLANGQNAAHGYAALAELDSNHDNLINQADELFSSLKVWQDINQDGISQSNELFTLQALGIQSLNLEHQENSKDLGNGNRLTHIGSYTKIDGTTGEMGDVEFAANRLYSRYTDTVELTPEQLKAPNLQSLGRLRDLTNSFDISGSLKVD